VDPALAGTALSLAARGGDAALFAAYRQRFEASTAPDERRRLLSGLAAFERPEVRRLALAYSLAGPLRPTELFEIPRGGEESEAAAGEAVAWLGEHWGEVTPRMPPDFIPFLAYFGAGCSEERLATVRELLTAPGRRVRGVDERLARVAEQVGDCVRLRRSQGPAVAAWLTAGADDGAPAQP
jgi:hypothetical protein